MSVTMAPLLPSKRLLAIIDTQNEITASALEIDSVMELVVERARALVDAAAGVVEVLDGEELVYHATSGTAEGFQGLRLRADASLSGRCVAAREVVHSEDASSDPRVDREAALRVGARSMVCVPLLHRERVMGVLKVYDPRARAFGEGDVETLRLLSGVLVAHLAHANAFEEEREASPRDMLTGLQNRRDFERRLAAEAARVRRHGNRLAVCLIDLNGFRSVNEEHGHVAGDDVLRVVAAHLDRSMRGEDTAFRLGGDEFALVLVGADEHGARAAAERIEAMVAGDERCLGVTAAWGVGSLNSRDPVAMLAEAHAALYSAKRAISR